MTDALLNNDEIDEIVQFEFPYVVANIYKSLLETDDDQRKLDLIFKTFNFSIRSLALMMVVRYLYESNEEINDPAYNREINDYLPNPRTQEWIDLLTGALEVYRGHRNNLMITELYDLYWTTDDTGNITHDDSAWQNLKVIAQLENDLTDQRGDRSEADILAELIDRLRQMMRDFIFMRNYDMLLVDRYDRERKIINVRLHRGNNIIPQSFHESQIANTDYIEEHYYYLTPRYPDGKRDMLRLDPLVVDPQHNNLSSDDRTIGIYNSWFDDPTDKIAGRLEYLILAANAREADTAASETSRHALVSKFLMLYENHLRAKEDSFKVGKRLTWETLDETFHQFSDGQMSSARSKYDPQVYVERQDFRQMMDMFLNARQRAVVLTGNAGAGKSNFLVSTYYATQQRDDIATLWLDGARLRVDREIPESIIEIIDHYLITDDEDSGDSAEKRLKSLLTQGVFSAARTPRLFVLIIDAINEHSDPIKALQLINTFINNFGNIPNLKVILSSRPQVWRYAKSTNLRGFTASLYYKDTFGLENSPIHVEHDSFVLRNYTRDEQIMVFSKLVKKYRLRNTSLATLSRSLRETLRDPLVMNITCRTFQGEQIPAHHPTGTLIEKLIDTLIDDDSNTLSEPDIDFLEDRLIPQFVPAGDPPRNVLTRTILAGVNVGSRTLDDLVADKTPYSDGEPVNAQFQRLMNTGWVIKEGPTRNYEVRFRYEYFYDYFIGKHIAEKATAADDPAAHYVAWALKIKDAPFLWGALRNSLFTLAERSGMDVIQTLIDATAEIYNEGHDAQVTSILRHLVVTVLAELHYNGHTGVTDFIRGLLPEKPFRKRAPLSALIALEVAYEIGDPQALARGLSLQNRELESNTIQFLFRMWTNALNLEDESAALAHLESDDEEIRQLRQTQRDELYTEAQEYFEVVLDVLRLHFKNLSIWRPRSLFRSIEMGLAASFALGFHEYSKRSISGRLSDILAVWQPFVSRFGFLFGSATGELSRFRRIMMYPIAFLYVSVARSAQTELLFSVGDMAAFFPPNDEKKDIMDRLTDYVVIESRTPEELEDITALSREVMFKHDDLMTIYIAWGVLCTVLIGYPHESASYVEKLYWEADYVDDDRRYTSPLTAMVTMSWQNLGFQSPHFSDEERLDLLDRYGQMIRDFELRFNGRTHGKKNSYYWCELPEHMVWHYRITGETHSPVAQDVFDHVFTQKTGDEQVESLRFIIKRFAHVARCSLWQRPNVALDNIREIILRLEQKPYHKLRDALKSDLAESIASIKAVAPDQVDDFIVSMEDAGIDPELHQMIIRTRPSLNIGYVISDGVIVFFRALIEDPDPTIREAFKTLMRSSNRSDNVYDWVAHQLLFILGHIRNTALVTAE